MPDNDKSAEVGDLLGDQQSPTISSKHSKYSYMQHKYGMPFLQKCTNQIYIKEKSALSVSLFNPMVQ
jgi:hypothetical protein